MKDFFRILCSCLQYKANRDRDKLTNFYFGSYATVILNCSAEAEYFCWWTRLVSFQTTCWIHRPGCWEQCAWEVREFATEVAGRQYTRNLQCCFGIATFWWAGKSWCWTHTWTSFVRLCSLVLSCCPTSCQVSILCSCKYLLQGNAWFRILQATKALSCLYCSWLLALLIFVGV